MYGIKRSGKHTVGKSERQGQTVFPVTTNASVSVHPWTSTAGLAGDTAWMRTSGTATDIVDLQVFMENSQA